MSMAEAARRAKTSNNSAAASTNIIINEDLIADPRPDLKEDSELWTAILKNAARSNLELYGILHGFRCMGTRLKHNSKGNVVLRPDIDPTGARAWASQQEYDQAKNRYLVPHHAEITELLSELGDEDTPPG